MSEEILKYAEELGGLFFSDEEIAEILETPTLDPSVRRAVRKGALLAEAQLRKSVIKLAMDGSSPAQGFAMRMLDQQKRKDY